MNCGPPGKNSAVHPFQGIHCVLARCAPDHTTPKFFEDGYGVTRWFMLSYAMSTGRNPFDHPVVSWTKDLGMGFSEVPPRGSERDSRTELFRKSPIFKQESEVRGCVTDYSVAYSLFMFSCGCLAIPL